MFRDFRGEFPIGKSFRPIQFMGFAGVFAAGQSLGGDGRDIAHIEEADSGTVHAAVKSSLEAHGGRDVGQNVLMKTAGRKDRERYAGGPEFIINTAVENRK